MKTYTDSTTRDTNIILNLSNMNINVFEVFSHCNNEVLRSIGNDYLITGFRMYDLASIPSWRIESGRIIGGNYMK